MAGRSKARFSTETPPRRKCGGSSGAFGRNANSAIYAEWSGWNVSLRTHTAGRVPGSCLGRYRSRKPFEPSSNHKISWGTGQDYDCERQQDLNHSVRERGLPIINCFDSGTGHNDPCRPQGRVPANVQLRMTAGKPICWPILAPNSELSWEDVGM